MRLPPELVERADRIARSVERSRAWVIEKALERYLEDEEQAAEEVQQALADAEAGAVVDGEEVHRWMDSWGSGNELPTPEPRNR